MTKEQFIQELRKLEINLTTEQLSQLEQFYKLLISWNEKINLTRIIDKEEVYLKHFYDSLTLVKAIDFTKVETLCDIGTGAGFPGIVLKIVFPHLKITLVDKLLKRVNYLNEVIKELNLKSIQAIHKRAEELEQQNYFDVVTARAVANLSTLCSFCMPYVKVGGYFIAMKGHIEEEMQLKTQIEKQYKCQFERIINFQLPYEGSTRNLLVINKKEKTPIYKKKIVRNNKKML